MSAEIFAVSMLSNAAAISAGQAGFRPEERSRLERLSVRLSFDDPGRDQSHPSIPPGVANFVAGCYPGKEVDISKIKVELVLTDPEALFSYDPFLVEIAVRPRIVDSQNLDLPEEETPSALSIVNRLNPGSTGLSFPGFIHIVTGARPIKYGRSQVSMRTILAAGGTGFNYAGMRQMTEPWILGELAGYLTNPESAGLPLSEEQRRSQPKREVIVNSGS